MGNRLGRYAIWIGIALVGALCWGMLALYRGETLNAGWILFAAIASYAIAYRFYSRFIANRVLGVDDNRATPGERLDNGRDFEPMDRRILFGHHFAAIAGAGPLVGPVLAAQMGFLPGTIWIIVGVILAGAVQAMTIPIALLMGVYLRFLRPGRVLEVSVIGVALLILAIFGGGWISESSAYAGFWTFSA